MGRDSLARHKMCRLWGNRDDLPTLSFGKSTCCRTRVLIRPTDPQNKHAPMGRGYFLADGEGFEPPVELPPQRFSRPSQSTALPPILNFWGGIRTPGGVAPTTVFKTVAIDRSATHPKLFFRRSFNLRFCSLIAPGGAAHHSFALDCAALVLLTRMQDHRNRPRLSPILNFFPPVFQPVVLFDVHV